MLEAFSNFGCHFSVSHHKLSILGDIGESMIKQGTVISMLNMMGAQLFKTNDIPVAFEIVSLSTFHCCALLPLPSPQRKRQQIPNMWRKFQPEVAHNATLMSCQMQQYNKDKPSHARCACKSTCQAELKNRIMSKRIGSSTLPDIELQLGFM